MIRDPHPGVSLTESFDFCRDPCSASPAPLCAGASPSWWLWGCSQAPFLGLHWALGRAAEALVHFHPFSKTLGFANLLLGLQFWFCTSPWCWDVLAQSPRGFWPGFEAVILSNRESLLGFFQQGLFQFGVPDSPHSLLLNQAFQCTVLDVSLPSQTSEVSVFI